MGKGIQDISIFRKLFILFFFTVMILFRTFLNRNMWANPLSDVMGGWWIWEDVNGEQKLATECFENLELSASAGGVIFPEQGEDFVSLCKNADAVLYDIKQNGKAAFKMK